MKVLLRVLVSIVLLWGCCGGAHAAAVFDTTNGVVALSPRSLEVQTQIRGAFSQNRVTTIYSNPNNARIEARLLYTAPPGAVVTGFAYWFGEEKVPARIVTRDRAVRIYDYITRRQRDPALVELLSQNSFKATIFPVMAQQDLKIEVQYVQVLNSTKDALKWTFPLSAETQTPLEKVSLQAQIEDAEGATASEGEVKSGVWSLEKANLRAGEDLTVQLPERSMPLRARLTSARGAAQNDGFFALSLVPDSVVTNPQLQITGVETYDVQQLKLEKLSGGEMLVVSGRFKGEGRARVSLGNRSLQLNFGGEVTPNSVAEKLWAHDQMAALSGNENNSERVIELSKRFGIPSKWTSWLAIPQVERTRYLVEVLAQEQNDAAMLLAQSIAEGDQKQILSRKRALAALNASAREANSRAVDVGPYLDAELLKVRSTRESAELLDPKAANVWKKREANLVKAGARDPRELQKNANDSGAALARIARQMLTEIEIRGQNTRRYASLKKQYQVEQQKFRRNAGYNSIVFEELSYDRARFLALQFQTARFHNEPASVVQRLRGRLERVLAAGSGRDVSYVSREAARQVFGGTISYWDKKLAGEIAAKRENGAAFKNYSAQLDKWRKKSGVPNADWRARGAWMQRIDAITQQMVQLAEDEQENTRAFQIQRAEVVRLRKRAGLSNTNYYSNYDSQLQYAFEMRRMVLAAEMLVSGLQKAPPERITELRTEISRLNALGWRHVKKEAIFDITPQNAVESLSYVLAQEIVKTPQETPRAKKRRELLEFLNQKFPETRFVRSDNDWRTYQGSSELWRAQRGRAHETAYQLLEARAKSVSPVNIAQLEAELEARARVAGKPSSAFLDVQRARREKGEPFLTAEQYRLKPGDPLISVRAPCSCRRAIAILPSGEVLTLRWNAETLAFEARFDVPGHALPGPYVVQIILVDWQGKRRQLALRFSVEVQGPEAQAQLFLAPDNPRLELECDARTDRVSAFFNNGERTELARESSGRWGAAMPLGIQMGESVRFVLTDAAHNRTEITLDLKPTKAN